MFPRQLWTKTVNALTHVGDGPVSHFHKRLTQEDLILDPLTALRCDRRVLRCGPLLDIVVYILKASLAASRTQLAQHILDNPMIERTGQARMIIL